MNIAQAVNILNQVQLRQNVGFLEMLIDYRNNIVDGFNENYGLDENIAFRVFMNQAQDFFAPAEV